MAPSASAAIDWSHPLSTGLVLAVTPDRALTPMGTVNIQGTPAAGLSGLGGYIAKATGAVGIDYGNFHLFPASTSFSVAVFLDITALTGTCQLIGKKTNFPTSDWTISIGSNAITTECASFYTTVTPTLGVSARRLIGASAAGTFLDGVRVGNATSTSGSSPTSAPIRIGGNAESQHNASLNIHLAAVWGRALSTQEHQMLWADPFCFLRY